MSILVAHLVMSVILISAAYADYTVACEGYNSETSSYIYGECSDGEFEGYDSETGNYIYGDCSFGGAFEAYDPETGVYVYGECEGD